MSLQSVFCTRCQAVLGSAGTTVFVVIVRVLKRASSFFEKSPVKGITTKEPRPFVAEYFSGSSDEYLELYETTPAIIAIEKLQYAYKCNHCGHGWTETKESEIGTEKGTVD